MNLQYPDEVLRGRNVNLLIVLLPGGGFRRKVVMIAGNAGSDASGGKAPYSCDYFLEAQHFQYRLSLLRYVYLVHSVHSILHLYT